MGLAGLFFRSKEGVETPLEVDNIMGDDTQAQAPTQAAAQQTKAEPDVHPDVRAALAEAASLRDELSAERAARADDARRQSEARALAETTRIRAESAAFSAGLVASNKLLPAGADALASVHAFAHLSAAGLPTDGIDLVAALAKLPDGLNAHALAGESVSDRPAGDSKLDKGAGAMTQERLKELLAAHPLGDAALANLK